MPRFKLAVVLESLGRPLRDGLSLASSLGVAGVQVDAAGPLAPGELSQSGRKDLLHLLRSLNLELAALGCPMRHGFNLDYELDARITQVKKVLTLAYDLGPRIVVAYPGPLPPEENAAARDLFVHSLAELDRHGEYVGARLALETGVEAPNTFNEFLSRFSAGGLGVNIDPASFLSHGHNPADAVRVLGQRIAHVHARDTRPLRPDRDAQEVPLGHGDIDWNDFLGALEAVEYRGWLTIKRGPSAKPAGDMQSGAAFLRRLTG
jgi:sugar phosphate isomerase/epimerase